MAGSRKSMLGSLSASAAQRQEETPSEKASAPKASVAPKKAPNPTKEKTSVAKGSRTGSAPKPAATRSRGSKQPAGGSKAAVKASLYFELRAYDDIEDAFWAFKDTHPDRHPTQNGFTSAVLEFGLRGFEKAGPAAEAFKADLLLPKPDAEDEDRTREQRTVYLADGLKQRITDEHARWRHENRRWLRQERMRPTVGDFTQAIAMAGLCATEEDTFADELPNDPRRKDS